MIVYKIFFYIKVYFFFVIFINFVYKYWFSFNIDLVISSNVVYLCQRIDVCWGIMDYFYKFFIESVKLIKFFDRNK